VADFYEDEVDNAVAGMTAMMEPMIIALLGGVIGFIVVAMYMPIFNLASVMGKD
jgi:type IV pilus assembly protein PilC